MTQVWGEPDEDEVEEVETFGDVIKAQREPTQYSGRFSGDPDQVSAPELDEEERGQIRISCGWHGDDYVWHLTPINPKVLFKTTEEGVLRSCANVMSRVIPQSISVNMHMPLKDWDIQEYTIKALDLKSCWQVQDVHLAAMKTNLFAVLNSLV